MPRRSRYDSYDDDRAYDAWLEAREEAEEAERQAEWEAEVDENCECVYEEGKAHYRYYDWDWVKPLEQCAWCAERARIRAEQKAAWQAEVAKTAAEAAKANVETAARVAAAAAAKKACTEELAGRMGIVLPDTYILPLSSMPLLAPDAKWRDQIVYVRERLYILEGHGLPDETRIRLIGDIFTFLAAPENMDIVRANDKFRAVVAAKLAEFRGDKRAEPIQGAIERMEAALQSIAA